MGDVCVMEKRCGRGFGEGEGVREGAQDEGEGVDGGLSSVDGLPEGGGFGGNSIGRHGAGRWDKGAEGYEG